MPGSSPSSSPATLSQKPGYTKVAKAINHFALNLFKAYMIRHHDNYANLVCAPFVVYNALASVYAGSRGTTKLELEKILQLEETMMTPDSEFPTLTRRILQQNSEVIFVGRFLYYDSHMKILEEYKEVVKEIFALKPKEMNFATAPIRELTKLINEDMREATEGVVEDVVTDQEVTKAAKLLLVNSVLFRGYWASAFDEYTAKGKPLLLNFKWINNAGESKESQVKAMKQTNEFKYHYDEDLKMKAVLVEYEQSDLAMLLLLPDNMNEGGQTLYNHLDEETFEKLYSKLEDTYVEVLMPRFALGDKSVSIKGTLEAMGSRTLFKQTADLTGISNDESLSLYRLVHKAFVVIDGKGAVYSGLKHPKCKNTATHKFHASHPFGFMIVDTINQVIVMAGFYGDPEETMEVKQSNTLNEADRTRIYNEILDSSFRHVKPNGPKQSEPKPSDSKQNQPKH